MSAVFRGPPWPLRAHAARVRYGCTTRAAPEDSTLNLCSVVIPMRFARRAFALLPGGGSSRPSRLPPRRPIRAVPRTSGLAVLCVLASAGPVVAAQDLLAFRIGMAVATVPRAEPGPLTSVGLSATFPAGPAVVELGAGWTGEVVVFNFGNIPTDGLTEAHLAVGVHRRVGPMDMSALAGPAIALATRVPEYFSVYTLGAIASARAEAAVDGSWRVGFEVYGHANPVLPVVGARVSLGVMLSRELP